MYRIDGQDRLVDVNDAYIQDAGDAGPTAAAIRATLLGRDFWSLIPEAAAWYEPLVRITRAEHRPFTFAFRCDTPTLRRLMRMHMEARLDGSVCFTSSVIRQQSRTRVALLDPDAAVGLDLVSMCSWCKRVRAGDDWLEVEPALDKLGIDPHDPMPGVSHGICQRCKSELMAMTSSRSATMSIRLPGPADLR
jgi:hypothetical protein